MSWDSVSCSYVKHKRDSSHSMDNGHFYISYYWIEDILTIFFCSYPLHIREIDFLLFWIFNIKQLNLDGQNNYKIKVEAAFFVIFISSYAEMSFFEPKISGKMSPNRVQHFFYHSESIWAWKDLRWFPKCKFALQWQNAPKKKLWPKYLTLLKSVLSKLFFMVHFVTKASLHFRNQH
jgi:hypothetical protein